MENMKKLVLVMAIVFAFGVTYAGNLTADVQTTGTEQVSSVNQDEKDKKEAKAEKKATKSGTKACSEKKACCSDKK
jgi:hypothetical protein